MADEFVPTPEDVMRRIRSSNVVAEAVEAAAELLRNTLTLRALPFRTKAMSVDQANIVKSRLEKRGWKASYELSADMKSFLWTLTPS